MGKLLTELNRTGHDCFGFRPVPWMCNLKYAEDGSSTIIPYRYKEAKLPDDPAAQAQFFRNKIDALEAKNSYREATGRKPIGKKHTARSPEKPIPEDTVQKPLPPFPAPREEVKPVTTPTIPDKIDLEDPLDTKSVVEPKGPIQPQSPSPLMDPLQARRTLEGIQNAKIPEAPAPAAPPAAPAPAASTPGTLTPTKLPPSQRQAKDLGFQPQMTQSGLQFIGSGKDGEAQTVYSPEEFEKEYGAYYKNQMISTGQHCDKNTYAGQIPGATQDIGFDNNGKIVTYVRIPGPNGEIVHRADKYGALEVNSRLSSRDGLTAFDDTEIDSGMAVAGWYKAPNGMFVNAFTQEVLNKDQYLHMVENEDSVKTNQLQDHFACNVTVDETMIAQGTFSGIMVTPYIDPTTHETRYMAYNVFKKDEDGKPLRIQLGNDYNHLFKGFFTRHQYSSDFAGSDPSVLNRFYDPTDPNGASSIPLMTDSTVFQMLRAERPKVVQDTIPTNYTVDEYNRVTVHHVNEKGETESFRMPGSMSNIIPVGERDYGFRLASQEECTKYGLPSGTILHMTQDKYGNRLIEAQNASGEKYGAVDGTSYDQNGDDLSRRFYTDPYAPQEGQSNSSDKWSQVLKYVMLGLPIGLALGLVGWGITGGKGNLGSALLGGAGLGATLGGLGAYSGLLGRREQYEDYDDVYGSAMNAGY